MLAITLSGDVHPQPGPLFDDTSTGRQADHRFPQNNISFFYANARSIVNKVDLLGLHLADKAYDVVVLVETHLDSSIADGKFFLRNTRSLARDRKSRGRFGGGVLIAVRDSIKASPKEDVVCPSELIFMDLLFANNLKITLDALYRPHNNDTKPLEELQQALDNLLTPELNLLGDFNLPDVDWLNIRATNNSTNYELLFDVIQDNFLSKLVGEPTRDQNILDHVLATSTDI